MLFVVLAVWGVFDLVNGVVAATLPQTIGEALFTSQLAPEGLNLVRRTGAYWVCFGAIELYAVAQRKNPFALALAAAVRGIDGVADVIWLASASFTTLGWILIGLSPLLCAVVAYALAREAKRRLDEFRDGPASKVAA